MQEKCLYYSNILKYISNILKSYLVLNSNNNKSSVDIEMQQIVVLKSIHNIILQENLCILKNLIL